VKRQDLFLYILTHVIYCLLGWSAMSPIERGLKILGSRCYFYLNIVMTFFLGFIDRRAYSFVLFVLWIHL